MGSSQDEVPEEVWEQDVADGGSVQGQLPAHAAAVVVQGVTLTREVPALAATFGTVSVSATGLPQRIGRNTRRRRILLSVRPNAITTAYVVIAENASQAAGGYGYYVLQGVAMPSLQYAGELWIMAFGADLQVGFISENDQG